MSSRKPLSNVRPKREFFVVAAPPSREFGEYYHFLSVNGHGVRNPMSAKRHYSRKSAEAFLAKHAPNPYMGFKVFKMMETRDGLSIHSLKDSYKKNPAKKIKKNPFKIGDRVIDTEYKMEGRVVFLGNYDDYAKHHRIKVEEKSGRVLWWNVTPNVKKVAYKKNPAPKHLNRVAKLQAMIDAKFNLLGRLSPHSPEYKKVTRDLDRLYKIKTNEILESRTPGTKKHEMRWKQNPAPGLRERSDRLHKLRLKLLSVVKKAEKIGSKASIDAARKKLLRVDRMISESAANFFSRRAKKRK